MRYFGGRIPSHEVGCGFRVMDPFAGKAGNKKPPRKERLEAEKRLIIRCCTCG